MPNTVWYSISPYGTGDIKTGTPTISISGGVVTISVAQTGNIGCGCCVEYNSLKAYIAPNRLGFDSGGTTEIKPRDKLEGVSSSATGIVRAVELTSGSWAGGDAAGYIYFKTTSGTWQNNEQINRVLPSSSSDVATVDGTLQGNIGNGNTQFVVKTATGETPSDQSSISLTSIHHEYASLNAYEAGFTDSNHINNTDLTASGADVIAFACDYYDHDDQTADTSAVAIDFSGTTDSTHYLQVFTPTGGAESINNQRHDGKWNDTKYRIISSAERTLEILEDYVTIEGLQVYNNKATGHIYGIYVANQSIGKVEINKSIVKIDGSSNSAYNNGNVFCWYANIIDIINCIIYGGDKTNNKRNGIFSKDTTVSVYNCTVSGAYAGINRYVSGIVKAINCAVFDNVDNFIGSFDTIDYCASDDGDGGTTAVVPSDWSSVFVDYTNGDFHLKSTDTDLKDAGTDLSSEGFSDDIDGDTRSGTWDIGADEYVSGGYTLNAESGIFSLTGQDVGLLANRLLSTDAGSFSLTGQDIDLLLGHLLNADSGSFVLSGADIDLFINRLLSLDSGSFVLTGQDIDLLFNRLLTADSGSFILTGQAANLLLNRVLSAEAGTFTISGADVSLLLGRVLGMEAGSFTLTGADVDFIYSGSGATYTLTAESGAFVLTGQDASLLVDRILNADSGSFALSGQDANLLLNRLLAAGSGSFTLSGQDVTLLADRLLNAESGAFSLTGQDASLLLGRLLNVESGSFSLVGQGITLLVDRRLNTETGTFTLTGSDVTFIWSGKPLAAGRLMVTFTPRKAGITFTSRKAGITLS